jgi:hypothetical protein
VELSFHALFPIQHIFNNSCVAFSLLTLIFETVKLISISLFHTHPEARMLEDMHAPELIHYK